MKRLLCASLYTYMCLVDNGTHFNIHRSCVMLRLMGQNPHIRQGVFMYQQVAATCCWVELIIVNI